MKLLIWGTGLCYKYWHKYILECNDIEIVAFTNNDSKSWGTQFCDKIISAPEDIYSMEYDYVLIATDGIAFGQIYKQLSLDMKIPKSKIKDINWLIKVIQKDYAAKKYKNETGGYKRKIYDCFTFYNELELLDIRLKMLAPYVDYFVLVEMEKTHRGKDKALIFNENRERFREYEEKIIYVNPKDIPEWVEPNDGEWNWTLENFQRECIMRGLVDCKSEDIIIISDLDEIPNPQYIDMIRKSEGHIQTNLFVDMLDETAVVMEQDMFYCYLNNRADFVWHGSIFVKYKNIVSPQFMRDNRNVLLRASEGGWHFSYLGNKERIINKVASIVEGYLSTVQYSELDKRILSGKLFDNVEYEIVGKELLNIEGIDEFVKKYPQFWLETAD